MKYTSIALGLTLALANTQAYAQSADKEQSIEKIVVVSSKVAMPLREIATSVSLITQEHIEARGFANLSDVLKDQPAIYVNNSGSTGSTTSLRIRGEEAYRTLVTIDGVDISDPTGTQVGPKLGHLQSANISRVEILRGSQGLSYGADAGGVVNIHSKYYQEQLAGSLFGEFGRYDTTNVTADLGGKNNDLEYYISGASFRTDGFNSRLDDDSEDLDGYNNTTIHSRLGYQFNKQFSTQLVLRNNKGNGEFDNCGFGASASNNCQSEFEQTNIRATLSYETDQHQSDLSYSKNLIERSNLNQGQFSFGSKGFIEKYEYLGNASLNEQHSLVYGLEWEQESITSAGQNRYNRAGFIEYQGEVLNDWFVTAAARHDDNDDFGEFTTYRVSSAYIWAVQAGELKLRSTYGTGFRAPSLFEVEFNRGPDASEPASSTILEPEESQGFEVGVDYTVSNGSLYQIVYFDQEIENAIEFDLLNFSGYLQEAGSSSSKGIELIASHVISADWKINANYTFNDTEDASGQQRARRPEHLTNIGIEYSKDRLSISSNIRLVKNLIDGGVKLDNYEILDISARFHVSEQLTVHIRAENLFDAKYQDTLAFFTPREAAYVGVRMNF